MFWYFVNSSLKIKTTSQENFTDFIILWESCTKRWRYEREQIINKRKFTTECGIKKKFTHDLSSDVYVPVYAIGFK